MPPFLLALVSFSLFTDSQAPAKTVQNCSRGARRTAIPRDTPNSPPLIPLSAIFISRCFQLPVTSPNDHTDALALSVRPPP